MSEAENDDSREPIKMRCDSAGLGLRDEFALKILPVAWADFRQAAESGSDVPVGMCNEIDCDLVAENCYRMTDAMLKHRRTPVET
jgi:hypothetical protein